MSKTKHQAPLDDAASGRNARTGANPFVTRFRIGGSGGIDAVSDTDGIDVTSANAGPGFEHGLLVAHDAANSGAPTSNLKYVPLDQILNLTPPSASSLSP